MNCAFRPTSEPDARGWRTWECSRCGQQAAPAPPGINHRCKASADAVFVPGPGHELKRLLAEFRIHDSAGCKCRKRVAEMNAWGNDGCREHRAEIVEWLREAAGGRGWVERITVGAKLLQQPWFKVSDPYGSLLDEAIARAEAAKTEVVNNS